MEGDARSTTHPIQQPIETEADANGAFDDITYKKGQSFIRMLESFLGEDVFRDGIRKYMARAQIFERDYRRSLERARRSCPANRSRKLRRAGRSNRDFRIVKVARDAGGKSRSRRNVSR